MLRNHKRCNAGRIIFDASNVFIPTQQRTAAQEREGLSPADIAIGVQVFTENLSSIEFFTFAVFGNYWRIDRVSRKMALSHPLWSVPWPSLSSRGDPGRVDVAGGWISHCEPAVETRDNAYSRGRVTHSVSYRVH